MQAILLAPASVCVDFIGVCLRRTRASVASRAPRRRLGFKPGFTPRDRLARAVPFQAKRTAPGLAAIVAALTPTSVRLSPFEAEIVRPERPPRAWASTAAVLRLRHAGGQVGERRRGQLERVRTRA